MLQRMACNCFHMGARLPKRVRGRLLAELRAWPTIGGETHDRLTAMDCFFNSILDSP
jgi:hypothetical protein